VADDHDSWGKTTARTQGFTMRGVEQWLASDEGMVAAHLSVGEKAAERGKLQLPSTFIAGGRHR
jgi:hypothetical protein